MIRESTLLLFVLLLTVPGVGAEPISKAFPRSKVVKQKVGDCGKQEKLHEIRFKHKEVFETYRLSSFKNFTSINLYDKKKVLRGTLIRVFDTAQTQPAKIKHKSRKTHKFKYIYTHNYSSLMLIKNSRNRGAFKLGKYSFDAFVSTSAGKYIRVNKNIYAQHRTRLMGDMYFITGILKHVKHFNKSNRACTDSQQKMAETHTVITDDCPDADTCVIVVGTYTGGGGGNPTPGWPSQQNEGGGTPHQSRDYGGGGGGGGYNNPRPGSSPEVNEQPELGKLICNPPTLNDPPENIKCHPTKIASGGKLAYDESNACRGAKVSVDNDCYLFNGLDCCNYGPKQICRREGENFYQCAFKGRPYNRPTPPYVDDSRIH